MAQDPNSERPAPIYVGVGVRNYVHLNKYQPLPKAVTEVIDFSKILSGYGYDVHVFEDPERVIADQLDDLLQQSKLRRGGSLVILWAGHGEPQPGGGLNLIAHDSKPGSAALITTRYIADLAARTGASQILLIFDTCFSGGGVLPAVEMVDAVLRELPPAAKEIPGVAVIASSLDYQKARDGVFGDHLTKLLRDGPEYPEHRQLWHPKNVDVDVRDFLEALVEEWDWNGAQVPKLIQYGLPCLRLPNPLYKPLDPDLMDAHLRSAARGGEPGEEGFFFSGRVAQLNRIVAWIQDGKPGAFVVTGPPGIGKSAILGRIVSLSNHKERTQLLAQESLLEHADPGEGSVSAHVHALRFTAERLVAEIAAQLVRNGLLPTGVGSLSNRSELQGAIQRSGKCPVIVVDGLNESGSESWRMAEDVLRTLSEVSLVLVGTRDLPPADGPLSLIKALGAKEVIDLGDAGIQSEAEPDLRRYIEKRLSNVMDPATDLINVSKIILESIREQPTGSFLLARFITTQIRKSPIDTSQPKWEEKLIQGIEGTIEDFVAKVPPLHRGGIEIPHAARELLAALAWAKGPGLPDDIWPVVATALSPTVTRYEKSDVSWLLPQVGQYIIEDGQGGRAVYRLLHQWLSDHFQPNSRTSPESDRSDDRAIKVARALVDYYQQLLTVGKLPQEPAYLWRYAWWHCADAGKPGIELFRQLVERDEKAFITQLAHALSALSKSEVNLGCWSEAAKAALETTEIYRKLVESDGTLRSDLAKALSTLGYLQAMVGQSQDAVDATNEAVDLYQTMDTTNPAVRLAFASTLTVLSLGYGLTGRAQNALESARDAVSLLRQLSSDNPAFSPDLAFTLSVLCLGYYQTGQLQEAVAAAKEAVDIFRTLDIANPAVRLQFGWALTVLGLGYSQTGQLQEGVAAAKEAVDIFLTMDTANPALRLPFGWALTVLGQGYSQSGQLQEGLAAAKEAVDIFRTMDTANPVVRPPFGLALAVLGLSHSQSGQLQEGLAAAKEAVDIFRTMDTANPAVLPPFGWALTVLGLSYSQSGQLQEGLAAAKEAVDIFRTMDTANPAMRGRFGSALAVLGLSYSQSGQLLEGLAAAKEAVDIFRTLDITNLPVRGHFGLALTILGLGYFQTDQLQEAVAAAKEAVDLFQSMDTANPAVRGQYGWALTVLGLGYSQTDQPQEAVAAAKEAVDLFRTLDTANPTVRGQFGWALAILGLGYSQTDQLQEAVAAAKESVDIYRTMDTANPAVSLQFGLALTVLGLGYSQTDQLQEAVDAAKEAVDIYRSMGTAHPAGVSLLADALNSLSDFYLEAGRGAEIDAEWEVAINSRERPVDKALLLLSRVQGRELGETSAVNDLIRANSYLTDKDRELAIVLHSVCRSIRAANPSSFDAAWRIGGGGDPPQWLTLDPSYLEVVSMWISMESTQEERDFLNNHIGRLPPEYDSAALDEIALALPDPSSLEPFRELLKYAREVGVDEAYRPRFTIELLYEWVSSELPTKRKMLLARREELLGNAVKEALESFLADDLEDPVLIAHKALLDLARAGKEDLAFQAIGDPNRASATLLELALADDVETLDAVATVVFLVEETDLAKARPRFYMAIALALRNQSDKALGAVSEALRMDRTQANAWLAILVKLAHKHQELVQLSDAIIAPPTSEDGDS